MPPGFCVTAEVFARFATRGGAAKEHLRELIAPAYERLTGGNGLHVAVRSSAIGEDSADASFAGQHDTFLHVTGVDAVVAAVMRCWESLHGERAVAYRERAGAAAGAMPVLVQRLVPADASAVAFSADPLTGERGVVRVNLARGLGEALVSGAVTPDVYLVTKDVPTIRERALAGSEAAVDDHTVLEIARLAVALEQRFGRPVDVEYAIERGAVHVVQCRPITSLPEPFEIMWTDPADAKLTWSRDLLHSPHAVPPLSGERFKIANPAMNESGREFEAPFTQRSMVMSGYIYATAERAADDEDELAKRLQRALEKRRAFGREMPEFWRTRVLPYIHDYYAWMEAAPIATASAEVALEIWDESWRRLTRTWQLHFYITGTAYPVLDELASLYEELFPGRSAIEALTLTLGISNEIHEMQVELYDLAHLWTREGDDAPAFREAFALFIERHGHLGHTINDPRMPSWGEEPERLLGETRKRASMPGRDPREVRRRALENAATLEARIRADLAGRPDDLARFTEVLAAARGVQPLTEGHNYELDRKVQTLQRRFSLRFGERLVRGDVIAEAFDIFLLYSAEVREALLDGRDRRVLVAERAAELARQERMRPPMMIGAPPKPLPPAFARNRYMGAPVTSAQGEIRGTGASAGLASGTARKVEGADDFGRVQPGDVLFCHATNPTFVPLFGIIAALVTDVGGELCHAAVVAREFGVPAVIGARDALKLVMEGATVEVDGTAGTVRILERPR